MRVGDRVHPCESKIHRLATAGSARGVGWENQVSTLTGKKKRGGRKKEGWKDGKAWSTEMPAGCGELNCVVVGR